MRYRHVAPLIALIVGAASAKAQPVRVEYVISGSANNWVYNFTLTNAMTGEPADMGVHMFGVELDQGFIAATPSGWESHPNAMTLPGSGRVYHQIWRQPEIDGVKTGQSLGGFVASSLGLAPTPQVRWFAFAESTSCHRYTWSGCAEPLFEGIATGSYPSVNFGSVDPLGEGEVDHDDDAALPPVHGASPITTTPEPSTYGLMASGLAALAFVSRRRGSGSTQLT